MGEGRKDGRRGKREGGSSQRKKGGTGKQERIMDMFVDGGVGSLVFKRVVV